MSAAAKPALAWLKSDSIGVWLCILLANEMVFDACTQGLALATCCGVSALTVLWIKPTYFDELACFWRPSLVYNF